MSDMVRFFKTRERHFPHYGFRSVHVEGRAEGNIWHQRHVWTRADGSLDIEEWIPSMAGFWRHDSEVTWNELAVVDMTEKPTPPAAWEIGEPIQETAFKWRVPVNRDMRFIADIYGPTPAECLRLAHLFVNAEQRDKEAEAMRAALEGMIGLCQLLASRGDLPETVQYSLTDHYRIKEARAVLSGTSDVNEPRQI